MGIFSNSNQGISAGISPKKVEKNAKNSKLWLFNALRQHRKLAEKRMIDFEKNKVAKYIMYFMTGLVVVYLLMFAVSFAMAANTLRSMSSVEFICSLIPLFVVIDFFIRFMAQQTPSQIIKPYVLLPIPRYTCIDLFIGGQMLNWSNLTWFIMLIPYCLMSVVFSYGIWACIGLLLFFWLLELCISQFYLIVRTLITDSMLWWLLPIGIAILGIMPGLNWAEFLAGNFKLTKIFDFEDIFRFYGNAGTGIELGQLWPYLMMLVLLVILVCINRPLQYGHVMTELSRVEKVTTIKNPSNMKFFDRLGEIGLFLGLEFKTALRNKNPRKQTITGIVLIIFLSALIIFTDVYDSPVMTNFWCVYDFGLFGIMGLVKIMANEGNYIDGLMVRKENILQILKAKYYYNCIVLILPFALCMAPVISGKWSFFMVLACGIFTAGFQFFLLFQLAVINRSSQPLNTKFISKTGIENNKWQFIIEMICMLVPVAFISILQFTLGATWAYVAMTLIGVAFIGTHKLWLRNIYNRFMQKRYENMEGFRSTR